MRVIMILQRVSVGFCVWRAK